MDELQLLKQKLCPHFHCTFHGMYSLIGNYICDYCKLVIIPEEYNKINTSSRLLTSIEYYARRLASGETINFTRDNYNKVIKLAEKVSNESEYSNGVVIFGDENPDYMNVRIWLVPKNTV